MFWITRLYSRLGNFFSGHCPRFYHFCGDHRAVLKFIVSGSSAAAVNISLLFLFHGVLKLELIFSTSAAFIISFLVSFTLQKFWAFRNFRRDKLAGQLFLYALNAAVGLNLNGLFMHLLVNRGGVWYLLSQVIVSAVLAFWNFAVYKFIIFRE
jgi:putative flippase GtrA